MSDDEARERRKAKLGTLTVEARERVQADAEAFGKMIHETPLLPGLVAPGAVLPDDDKPAEAGRPVGARATRPAEYARFILATRGDFLGRCAGIAQADTLQLAKVLGCSPLEALNAQAKLASIAAPYVYQPQSKPPEERAADYFAGMVFMAGRSAAPALPGQPAAPAATMDALAALAGRPPDMQEIQALRPVEFVASEPASSEPEEQAP